MVGLLWSMVLGGYPRSRLARYTMRDLDSGRLSAFDGASRIALATAHVVGAQVSAGMRYVVDGMLDWHDLFRPFVESWRNVYLDGLIRYFDNNFFYRIPVFRGEPEPQRLVLPGRVRGLAPLAEPAGVKAVLPGPVTLARLGRNESGLEDEELVARIARALAEEVRGAAEAGAGIIQVDEPFLADMDATAEDAELASEALEVLRKAAGGKPLVLAVYFDVPRLEVFKKLTGMDVDYLSLDVGDAPSRAVELVKSGCRVSGLAVGVIDARRLYDDDLESVASLVDKVVGACRPDEVVLTTTTWLDLIPYRFSLRKTALLGRYAEVISERLGLEYVSPITSRPKEYIQG